jgi:predicted DsbA family dithiol-disulfide isomerase
MAEAQGNLPYGRGGAFMNAKLDDVLVIEIYSDLVCPWCFIGKRRFEKALQLSPRIAVEVVWRPFELNPDMPEGGIDRREYRTRKFGSWEHSQELDQEVAAAGAGEGIEFSYELMKRTPNTFKGHMLVEYALQQSKQDRVVEQLFDAYFCKGLDIGSIEVLMQIGEQAGFDRANMTKFFDDPAQIEKLKQEEQKGRRLGINGVPAFVLDDALLFSGAQNPKTIAESLKSLRSGVR